MDEQHKLGSTLREAVLGAALHAPAETPRPWLWPPRRWWKRLAVLIVCGMAIGLTGGTIGFYNAVFHVYLTFGWLVGAAQAAPMVVAPRWPLIAWRIMVAGQFIGVFGLIGQNHLWPWPVTSFIGLVVVLILLAISCERRTSGAAALITLTALMAPAVVVTHTPLWMGVIVGGIVALAVIFGDALGGRYAAEIGRASCRERV